MTVNELLKEKCVTVAAILMAAFTASATPLPQPEFADAGACTNVSLPALSASGVLSFSLSFAPDASNNVEVAFGTDLDGDGMLSPDEWRMVAGAVTGYFSNVQTPLHMTHDVAMGAGVWWPVSTNAYWRMDTVRAPLFPHPWSAGTLRWKIPMAWGYPFAGDREDLRQEVLPKPAAMQIYTMGEWGATTIQKSGHVIERNIFNDIWLDGVKVN